MKKIILSFFILSFFMSSCKKDKEKDPFAGQFALKLVLSGGTPQYVNGGTGVPGGSVVFNSGKYTWNIEKAADDKYYIIATTGNVIASNASGSLVVAAKITPASDAQLFKFIPGGGNDKAYYLQLASDPAKYISAIIPFGSVYFGAKDAPCVPGPGGFFCYYQKFILEP